MNRLIYIVLLLLVCGCSTAPKKRTIELILWKDVQTVMNNPYEVDAILLNKHKASPKRETKIIERSNDGEKILWEYDHVKWNPLAPGLTISTTKCLQHHTDKERRRWLTHISIDVGLFIRYLEYTNQIIPYEMKVSPNDVRKQYGKPTSDSVDEKGTGLITWSIYSKPPYNIHSNVRMQFKRGILMSIEFGE